MLKSRHIKKLKESGVGAAFAEDSGIESVSRQYIRKEFGWKGNLSSGGILIRYPNGANSYYSDYSRIRLSEPVAVKQGSQFGLYSSKQRTAKYLSPESSTNHLYISKPLWGILNEKHIPLFFVEGEFKALALLSNGFMAIGLAGTHGAYTKGKLLDDFNKISLQGRHVYVAYDGDKAVDPNILNAEKKFCTSLVELGAVVKIVFMPDLMKPDDYLVEFGKEKFNLLVQNAVLFEKGFSSCYVARIIQMRRKLIFAGGDFYEYENGVYKVRAEQVVKKWIKEIIKDGFTIRNCNEAIHALETDTYIDVAYLNVDKNILNFENGLLDMRTFRFKKHDSNIYSTIQIPLNYDQKAKCPLWKKSIEEIFEGNEEKIRTLQEFLGYCLKPDNSQQKALLNVGKGANGKSVIFGVFLSILGKENCSSIPLESLGNRHYLAGFYNKLVNVSIESQSNKAIHDANFKAIVSGDSLTADKKYKPVFEFRPYVRLIFAMNELPVVTDKTDAFFRRLIILRYPKQFSEKQQDKNIEKKLLAEVSGILNWFIKGLKRLERRGNFRISKEMRREVKKYRMENNNVLIFVSEAGELFSPSKIKAKDKCKISLKKQLVRAEKNFKFSITKEGLYDRYTSFCKQNGYYSSSKINFGKQLKDNFKQIKDGIKEGKRSWENIGLKNIV